MHMHVAGLSVLDPSTRPDGRLRFEDVEAVFASRLHLAPRFRQKVDDGAVRPRAARVGGRRRVRPRLPPPPRGAPGAPAAAVELAEQVQRILSRPLDRSKPLWELYVIEGLEDGHVATLMKVHHAMIDGLSGMHLTAALFDLSPEPPERPPPPAWQPEPEPSSQDLLARGHRDLVRPPGPGADERDGRGPPLARGRGARRRNGPVGVPQHPRHGRAPGVAARRADRPQPAVRDRRRAAPAVQGDQGRARRHRERRRAHRRGRRAPPAAAGPEGADEGPHAPRDGAGLGPGRRATRSLGNRVAPAFVDLPVGAMGPKRRLALVREGTALPEGLDDGDERRRDHRPRRLRARRAARRGRAPGEPRSVVQPRRLEHPRAAAADVHGRARGWSRSTPRCRSARTRRCRSRAPRSAARWRSA